VPAFFAIVAGKDEYLVDRDARAFYEKASKKAGADVEKEVISGMMIRVDDAPTIERQFIESVQTVSMFGGSKVIWLRNWNWITDSIQGKSDEVKECAERILKVASECAEQVSVIISATPYDGRRKDLSDYKSIAHEFIVHSPGSKSPFGGADPQAEMQMELASKRLQGLGVKFARGVPEAIIGRVGQSTRVVLMECEKLAIYAGPGGTIKESDVYLVVPTFGDGDFFEPIEAWAARDLPWALEALERYFFNLSSCRPLLAALQSRLRLLIQLRSCVDAGDLKVTSAGLAKGQFTTAVARHGATFGSAAKSSANLFSQNDWYISTKVAPAAANYTLSELIDAQLACGECFDLANRGGDEEQAVRTMFLRALAIRR
jgi:DNA polymerase-3 subunit delta